MFAAKNHAVVAGAKPFEHSILAEDQAVNVAAANSIALVGSEQLKFNQPSQQLGDDRMMPR